MDQVVLACDQREFEATLQLAKTIGVGLEIQAFGYPEALDGAVNERVARYREQLAGFDGRRTMHGAFMDMASGSQDSKIAEVTEFRYRQGLQVAQALDARLIVFHLNYLTHIRAPEFRRLWTDRQVDFWKRVGRAAADAGLIVALENMWEWEPSLIRDVLDRVELPNVQACLDVGHARLYSDRPLGDWLAGLGPHLVYAHVNNTDGTGDQHRALDDGILDYRAILPQLRALPKPPTLSLEITGVEAKRRSLGFFDLAAPTTA